MHFSLMLFFKALTQLYEFRAIVSASSQSHLRDVSAKLAYKIGK